MYAESGLMFPQFQSFIQRCDELWFSQKPNDSWGIPCSLVQTATISDYNLGGAGDLFKAPEPVLQEPTIVVDPITAAFSMISGAGKSPINSGQLLNDVFYECEKDLLAKEVTEVPFPQVDGIEFPSIETPPILGPDEKLLIESPIQSSALKSSNEAPQGSILDFMTNASDNIAFAQTSTGVLNSYISEDRMEKLSRYRSKKSKRNFGRKIKYACRKALADGQPRIRGRFAKTEDLDCSSKQ